VSKFRVCVTDDCTETAAVLCEGLKLHSYEAIAVHTGEEAIKVCTTQKIDLILLDVCLPKMSGYDVCKCLRENPKTQDICVIFVTVKGAPEDVSRGFELGAADYITKPYNLPVVMLRVDAALRKKLEHERLRTQQEFFMDNSYTDYLTGLRNRRYLLERLQEEVEKAHRYDYPVSCVVFDVDEVRGLDEELGPVSLDDLLIEIAMTLRNHSRTYDVLARYDGTLFAAVLPHSPKDDARQYASKIMDEIGSTTFSDPNFPTEAKVSVGIVACQNGSARGAEFVLGEAMRALLQAKSLPEERLVARNLSE
jgi:two-component system cell cycle response regulator